MQTSTAEISPLMGKLSAYIAQALTTELPPEVVEKAKLHILDTIAAIISGSRLLPGIKAAEYARTREARLRPSSLAAICSPTW